MTNQELLENWKEYEVESLQGARYALKDAFVICWGELHGGLLFDTGNESGDASVLKPDEHMNCWLKTQWHTPDDQDWILYGRFIRIPN